MNIMKTRAQAYFPSVLLTLVSIIQALALELMWSKIVESEWLWKFNMKAVIGWRMILVASLGIIQVCVMYSTMVMGFIWQPDLKDSIIPFVIGIQEFMLVTLIGEEFNTLWLYALGSVFISANWVSHSSLRRARQNPEKEEFFGKVELATLRDFWPALTIVTSLVIFGISIDVTQNQTWLPLVALIVIFQIVFFGSLWRSILGLHDEEVV